MLNIDNSCEWKTFIHLKLRMRGRQIEKACGNEWFNSSPDELREIAEAQTAEIARYANGADKGQTSVRQAEFSELQTANGL